MTLEQIYNEYTPGSQGFAIAVETHCGFSISRDEIKRISSKADNAEKFWRAWEKGDWWADEVNGAR